MVPCYLDLFASRSFVVLYLRKIVLFFFLGDETIFVFCFVLLCGGGGEAS